MTGRSLEGRASRQSVLAVRAADRAAIVVRGTERTSWLNGIVTCELAKSTADRAEYGLIVEKKGKIQSDLFIVSGKDELVLAVPAHLRDSLMTTLDHYLVMEDAELERGDFVFWLLHGPKSGEVLSALSLPAAGILDLIGAGGAVLAVPSSDADATASRIASEVSRHGGAVADEAVWEAVRIEAGLPRFGVEFDTTLYPQEASLEKLAVSFEKGCYLGQEVVYMLEHRGHAKKKLVPLDVEGEGALTKGDAVTTPEGEAIGEVRSSVVGPVSEHPVAIAMVKWAQAKPGTELRAGGRVARVRA